MVYDRKIKYLDYSENGERVRGGGFVKMEVRDGNLRMEIKVTGLHPTDSYDREILLRDEKGEKPLGSMAITGGKGQYLYMCHDLDDIGGTGISYSELQGIRIALGAGREISCILQSPRMEESTKKPWRGKQPTDKEEVVPDSEGGRGNERKAMTEADQKKWAEEEKLSEQKDDMYAASRETLWENGQRERTGERAGERTGERTGELGAEKAFREITRREDTEKEEQMKAMREFGQRTEAGEGRHTEGVREARKKAETEEGRRREGMQEIREKAEAEEGRRGEGMQEIRKKAETEEGRRREGMQEIRKKAETEEGRRREGMQEIREKAKAEEGRRGEGMQEIREKAETEGDWRREGIREFGQREQTNKDREKMTIRGTSGQREPEKPVPQMEDKWAQLWSIYPHIHPFRDEREYLSIKPSDFVLFPSESYKMVNNSFLLHGYYNYHHLLLGKVEKKGEAIYYIGVPGNFYEREKQVAIMFGFESFECAEEPAQAGDFGYYMMRTKL